MPPPPASRKRPLAEVPPAGQVPQPPRKRGRPPRKPREELEICVICKEVIVGDRICAGTDALRDIIRSSEQRGDGRKSEFEQYLSESEVLVHAACRRVYTKRKSSGDVRGGNALAAAALPATPAGRSQVHPYTEKSDCLLCGLPLNLDVKKLSQDRRKKEKVHLVHTTKLDDTLRRHIAERDDEWGKEVQGRLDAIGIADRPAVEAKYHTTCLKNFYAGRSKTEDAVAGPGRPAGSDDQPKEEGFEKICEYMQNRQNQDYCQFSIEELEREGGGAVYCRNWLKKKLIERFGNAIHITDGCGRQGAVVNLTGFTNKLLHKLHSDSLLDEEEERQRIVKAASQIILEDIRKKNCSTKFYRATPSADTCDPNVPLTLNLFLSGLITSRAQSSEEVQKKRNVLGQVLMYAARPKSYIPPTLLDITVDLHTTMGCRDQIDKQHKFGLLVGYNEVKRYEFSKASAARKEEKRKEEEKKRRKEAEMRGETVDREPSTTFFHQYGYDNLDHNTETLGGHGTLHVLGGVRITTPAPPPPADSALPRLDLPSSALQIARELDYTLEIKKYNGPTDGLKSVLVEPMESTALTEHPAAFVAAALAMDTLWMTGRWNNALAAPSWQGYMKSAMARPWEPQLRSLVEPLPFINLPASNYTALHTALHFAVDDAESRGQYYTFANMDQQLYCKAVQIAASGCCNGELKRVVVRLGGFHLVMSFLGAIGHIMSGSGLEVLWEEAYAALSAKHMMTGKAYSRAVRAHFLTQEAIGGLLLDTLDLDSAKKDTLRQLHEDFLTNKVSPEEVSTGDGAAAAARDVWTSLRAAGEAAAQKSRTAKLWWQYFYLVALLRLFVRAERVGDWALHKECVKAMLPYFHAAGHIHYAKSAHLYVQQMEGLTGVLLEAAEKGLFAVRRTSDFWAGVWADMVIEQDYMRMLKVVGGLIMRRVTESTAAQLILSRRHLLDVVAAVEQASGVCKNSSEQHVDLRPSRQETDTNDLNSFTEWLKRHNPFQCGDDIQCLHTGELGSARRVNCDQAKEVGVSMMEKGYGNNFADLKVSSKDSVVPLSRPAPPPAKGKEQQEVDTFFLFMKMALLNKSGQDIKRYLTYELAPYPPALFDEKGLMRHNAKSDLKAKFRPGANKKQRRDIICAAPEVDEPEVGEPEVDEPEVDEPEVDARSSLPTRYVVDGGHFLHSVKWPVPADLGGKKVKFKDVRSKYTTTFLRNYGREAILVLDRYGVAWSTKREEQKRRATGKKAQPVTVEEGNYIPNGKQEEFLSNEENKSALIKLLKTCLKNEGVKVFQARADADVMVAEKALELDEPGKHNVRVIATDTDILAILVARAGDDTGISMSKGAKDADKDVDNIRAMRRYIGSKNMLDCVLVEHAFSGCDTTSAAYQKGKVKLWENLVNSENLRRHATVFNVARKTREEIAKAGEALFLSLYCGGVEKHRCDNLNDLREVDYNAKIASSKGKVPNFALLPMTSDSAHHHSFRVYLQVQEWLGNADMLPTAWGWKSGPMIMEPIPTKQAMAPPELLEKTSCNCSPTGCKNGQCSCRKRGNACNLGCGKCKGQTCQNTPEAEVDDWDD